jgi:hypothetical protein
MLSLVRSLSSLLFRLTLIIHHILPEHRQAKCTSFSISPDGCIIARGFRNGLVETCSIIPEGLRYLSWHTANTAVSKITFLAKGTYMVTTCDGFATSSTITQVWYLFNEYWYPTGPAFNIIRHGFTEVHFLSSSRDLGILSLAYDSTHNYSLRVTRPATSIPPQQISLQSAHPAPLCKLSVAPDGQHAVVVQPGEVWLFQTEPLQALRKCSVSDYISDVTGSVLSHSFAFTRLGPSFVVQDSLLREWPYVWDYRCNRLQSPLLPMEIGAFNALGAIEDPPAMLDVQAVTSKANQASVALTTQAPNLVQNSVGECRRFSRDGKRIAVCDTGLIRVYDVTRALPVVQSFSLGQTGYIRCAFVGDKADYLLCCEMDSWAFSVRHVVSSTCVLQVDLQGCPSANAHGLEAMFSCLQGTVFTEDSSRASAHANGPTLVSRPANA